jgi:hypothetical protein
MSEVMAKENSVGWTAASEIGAELWQPARKGATRIESAKTFFRAKVIRPRKLSSRRWYSKMIAAGFHIHQRCKRLIETLPALQHDPNRPEDVLKVDADEEGVGGDDAADCLRYLVATKVREVVERRLRGL